MAKNVVIIDDQKAKWDGISDFFYRYYPSYNLSWIKYFRQAQNRFGQEHFDLLILDMTFPVHGAIAEDLGFNGLAGLHVLQFMWRSKLKIPTIICTSHENYSDPDFGLIKGVAELDRYVHDVFGNVVLGCVLMDPDENVWHREMKLMVDRAPE